MKQLSQEELENSTKQSSIKGSITKIVFINESRSFKILAFQCSSTGESFSVVDKTKVIENPIEGAGLEIMGVWGNDKRYGKQFVAEHLVSQDKGAEINSEGSTIIAEITKVIYRGEDSDFVIFAAYNHNDAEEFTATAKDCPLEINKGDHIRMSGSWVIDKKFGRQFSSKTITFTLPTTSEGIAKYLGSGIINGIGPKTAKLIVKKFKEKTLDILDNDVKKLYSVKGLGKKKVEAIIKVWETFKKRRETEIQLASLEISTGLIQKIISKYGYDAPETIRQNPYLIIRDIEGVGFKIADALANKVGIKKEDLFRIGNGVIYTLEKLSERGHVCYPENELIKESAKLLDVDQSLIPSGLKKAEEDFILVKEQIDDINFYYSRPLHSTEQALAKRLIALSSAEFEERNTHIPSTSTLNEDQQQAVKNVFNNGISIITGGPGVGKTTTIGQILTQSAAIGLNYVLTAPTGRAAKRMSESTGQEAKTIHRLLIFDPENYNFKHNLDNQIEADLIIVDEASMLDLKLAKCLFDAIPKGCHIVIVGDKDQLPSVGAGAVLHDLMACGRFPVTMLNQVYRQAENSNIISTAHSINKGQMPKLHIVSTAGDPREASDFFWVETNDPEKVEKSISMMVADRIPQRFGIPSKNIQVLAPMRKGTCGTERLNTNLQEALNTDNLNNGSTKESITLGFKKFILGDRIMQTKNNYDKGVFNGDIGIVDSISLSDGVFIVNYGSGRRVDYSKEDINQLELAYAVTIHKSQGSEFDAVVIPLVSNHYAMLQKNLLYTGVTRAKKLLILVGSRQAMHQCVNNNKESKRYSGLIESMAKFETKLN